MLASGQLCHSVSYPSLSAAAKAVNGVFRTHIYWYVIKMGLLYLSVALTALDLS